MSWLSKVTDLAGKAETLLNQLDQNTAQALSKPNEPGQRPYAHATPTRAKRPSLDELSSGIQLTSEQPSAVFSAAPREYASSDYGGTGARQKSSGYASSVSSFVSKAQPKEDDEKLLAYLNEPNDDTGSTKGGRSRRSSGASLASLPQMFFQAVASATGEPQAASTAETDSQGVEYTFTTKMEREMNELKARDADSRKTLQAKDSQLAVLRVRLQESDQLLQSRSQQVETLKAENTRLLRDSKDSTEVRNQALETLQQRLQEAEGALEKEKLHVKQLEAEYRDRVQKLEDENANLALDVTGAQKMVTEEKLRSKDAVDQLRLAKYNLEANKHEFDEYKQKAQRILQTKEKLIETLKEGAGPGEDQPGLAVELEEIRAERDMMKDDLQQTQLMVYNLKAEIQDLETQLTAEQRGSLEQQRSLQEQCQSFQASASQYREQLEQLKMEYQYIQDELRRQHSAVQSKLQEKDAEIARLMSQSTARSLNVSSNGELEQRIRLLTENLIQKQTLIEALQTDKNSLGLQLERLERMYREAESAAIRSSSVAINMGTDSENVSSRVPAFMRENPYDTGVTRGVKRAYGTLDTLRLALFSSISVLFTS
uniref:Golgin-84 n=1 Tax=Plectus sambesii TaxID=2011161 RepID=A0A914WIR4_9BILA